MNHVLLRRKMDNFFKNTTAEYLIFQFEKLGYKFIKTNKMDQGIQELIGKIISEITDNGDELIFTLTNGEIYRMHHDQNCCESVSIEDIDGDLCDLIGSPILVAEERTDSDNPKEDEYIPDSFTWTFYTIRNINASVTIRWYGTSNGYYSESVNFEKINFEN